MAQQQRARMRALRRLGVPPQRAEVGRSSRGAWRIAGHAGDARGTEQPDTETLRVPHSIRPRRDKARWYQPPDAENRTSGGVGAVTGAIPSGDPIQRSGLISSEWPAGPRSDRPGAGERAVPDHDGVIVEGDSRADVARDGMKHVADLKSRCVRSFGDEMLFAVGGKDGVGPLDEPRARLGVFRGHSLVAEIEREAITRRLADHAGKDSGCGNKRQVRKPVGVAEVPEHGCPRRAFAIGMNGMDRECRRAACDNRRHRQPERAEFLLELECRCDRLITTATARLRIGIDQMTVVYVQAARFEDLALHQLTVEIDGERTRSDPGSMLADIDIEPRSDPGRMICRGLSEPVQRV